MPKIVFAKFQPLATETYPIWSVAHGNFFSFADDT